MSTQEELEAAAEAAIRHIDEMEARHAETHKAQMAVIDALIGLIDAITGKKEGQPK